jgi:hypothetical protein
MEQLEDKQKNPHRFQRFTAEYAGHVLGIGNNGFKGQKYEDIPEDELILQNALFDKIMIVLKAITDKHPKREEFISDSMSCPICQKGTVKYNIHGHVNGHIHANCDGCLLSFGM